MLEVGVILGDQVMEWQSGSGKKICDKNISHSGKVAVAKKVCEKKYISDRVAKAVTEKCVKKYW